jgi:hypothetical protein
VVVEVEYMVLKLVQEKPVKMVVLVEEVEEQERLQEDLEEQVIHHQCLHHKVQMVERREEFLHMVLAVVEVHQNRVRLD